MNIDKDEEKIIKGIISDFKSFSDCIIEPGEKKRFWKRAKTLEKVLSELESYKGKIIHLSDEEYNKVIENAQKDIKKEAETWKKIAEKLAEIFIDNNEDYDCYRYVSLMICNGRVDCKQCIIDWARKEVEKQ